MQKMLSQMGYANISQAYLMIGPRHSMAADFVRRFVASIICSENNLPCTNCKNCRMFANNEHPDVRYIGLDVSTSMIKIEQIRNLQLDIYQTPQCAANRFIIINPADKLNIQSANSLLKILEEPPAHTIFILIAEQINSLPLTIISRCQRYYFKESEQSDGLESHNYLSQAELYEEGDQRSDLFKQRFEIISLLNELVVGKTNACAIAIKLKEYQLDNIVWFLYLLTSEGLKYLVLGNDVVPEEYQPLYQFAKSQDISTLYKQIDTLNRLVKKAQQNISLNSTLVLENILLGYLSC
ncbi:MAG: DNA polymerase III subunit delta' C-terminal domain-containing protein [Legionellaceae bacterium]|nr:DNA polymerase III subunit delta' C-terminal domain-containing protein [Legionellaceae bacterium]